MNLPECLYFAPNESPDALAAKLNIFTIQIANALDGRLGMENMGEDAYGDGLAFQDYKTSPGNPTKQRLINTLADSSGGGYISPKEDLAGDVKGMEVFVDANDTTYGKFCIGDSNDPTRTQIGSLIPDPITETNPKFKIRSNIGRMDLNTGGAFDIVVQRNDTDKFFFGDASGTPILQFEGQTGLFPGLKKDTNWTTGLAVRTADDSRYGDFSTRNFSAWDDTGILDTISIQPNDLRTILGSTSKLSWGDTAAASGAIADLDLARVDAGKILLYDSSGANTEPSIIFGEADNNHQMIKGRIGVLEFKRADDASYSFTYASAYGTVDSGGSEIAFFQGPQLSLPSTGEINFAQTSWDDAVDVQISRAGIGIMKVYDPSNSAYGILEMSASGKWLTGAGSPEGAVTASRGSYYVRTDGAAGTSFYIKESGTSNTGWNAVPSAGTISGTSGRIPKFTGTNSIGDGLLHDNGTMIGWGGLGSGNAGIRTNAFTPDTMQFRLADDSGYSLVQAGRMWFNDTLAKTFIDPTASAWGPTITASSDCVIGWDEDVEAGAGDLDTGFLRTAAGSVKLFSPSGITSAFKLQFGGATSSEPMIKRSSTIMEAKLADDSALTGISMDQNSATMQIKRDLLELAPSLAVGELFYATNANMLLIGLE